MLYLSKQTISVSYFWTIARQTMEVYYQIFHSVLNSELETGNYMWHVSGEFHQ